LLDRAVVEHALGGTETHARTHERLGPRRLEIVEERACLPADLEYVLEAGRRDEGGRHAAALEHRVGRDRGPVGEPLRNALAEQDRQALDHGTGGIVGRRRQFVRAGSRPIAKHDVRERAAGVDAHDQRARCTRIPPGA
jgi:hypothetical protein